MWLKQEIIKTKIPGEDFTAFEKHMFDLNKRIAAL